MKDKDWKPARKPFQNETFLEMSDMFIEVFYISRESLMILALIGQKLLDHTSFGLKTDRSKNRSV